MKQKWFKNKTYGWGWYPATWQGWVVLLIYILYLAVRITIIATHPDATNEFFIRIPVEMIIATLLLIAVCFITGEKPGWHWGDTKKKKRK